VSQPVRFGIFQADLEAGDLRRKGFRLKLQNQPFRVLAALLERPGELVTREELRDKIWTNDTLVDFERGLNKAINRLRIALGDSAENSTLIETVPRRGYRFIAAVEHNINSVAVLPILNLSGDPNQEYWADGLTDELISHIARIETLRVISRTSVMRFKASTLSLPEISRQLGVDAVVQGSVLLSNDKVRIRIALINARNDRHLWADRYEGDFGDIVSLQEQVAQAVMGHVRAQSSDDAEAGLSRARSSVRREAYEAYLKGRYFWNKRTDTDVAKAVEFFKQAISLEPLYAEAYAGLADAFNLQAILGLRAPREVYPKAKAAAERALELNDRLAEAHTCLADIHKLYTWDWRLAEKGYESALQLNPNYSLARQWYAGLLLLTGRHQKAIAEVNRARELDPLSVPITAFAGYVCMKAQKYDEAKESCAQAIELDPNNPFGHWVMARVLDARKELRAALVESEAAARLSGGDMLYFAQLGYALARIGEENRAREIIDRLTELAKSRYVSAYAVATIHAAQGDKNAAFEWLEKSYNERTPRLVELPDIAFASIERDPRFEALMERIRPSAQDENRL
jgi:TolB-like protein/Flp pilus assembly protein TadD